MVVLNDMFYMVERKLFFFLVVWMWVNCVCIIGFVLVCGNFGLVYFYLGVEIGESGGECIVFNGGRECELGV